MIARIVGKRRKKKGMFGGLFERREGWV